MQVKVYNVTLQVLDFNNQTGPEVMAEIENSASRYLNVDVKYYQEATIEEWTDDHPLNKKDTCDQAFKDLWE